MAVLSLNPGARQAGGQSPAPNEAQHFRASENVAHPMSRETRVSETGGAGTGRVRDGRELALNTWSANLPFGVLDRAYMPSHATQIQGQLTLVKLREFSKTLQWDF